MWRMASILAAVAAFVYVAVAGVQWLTPRIEEDLANRVTTALAERGLLWAQVDVKGRVVTLSGDASDVTSKNEALITASQVFGVAKVNDELAVAGDEVSGTAVVADVGKPAKKAKQKAKAEPSLPYLLSIEKVGEAVMVSGSVPDEQTAKVLKRIAETHYGADKVTTRFDVVAGAPAGWRTAAGTVLFNIANLEKANVVLSGTEVMLEGEVLDKDFADKTETAIREAIPNGYKVAYAIDTVEVVAADVSSTTLEVTPEVDVAAVEPAAGDVSAVAVTAGVAPTEEPVVPVEEKAPAQAAAPVEPAPTQAVGVTCAMMAELRNEVVLFDFDKTEIKDAYAPVIQRVAGVAKGCAEEKVTVAGYTDATGSKLYNKWLSQQRAEAGMRALMREGVAKDQLKAVGFGEKFPVASNKSKAGRAANRRVEFVAGEKVVHDNSVGSSKNVSLTVVEILPAADVSSTSAAGGWWDDLAKVLGASPSTDVTSDVSSTEK